MTHPPMQHYARLDDLSRLVGTSLGTSEEWVIDQARIDRFAHATDDLQWIHMDAGRATEGPFGVTVAHGYLTLSLLPAMMATAFRVEDVRMGVNYGLNRVRFVSPVRVDSRLRARFELIGFDPFPGGALLTMSAVVTAEGIDRPVCVAETLSRRHR